MSQDLLNRLTSRKLLLTVAAIAYCVVQIAAGAITTQEGLDSIWKLVAAYIAAEGLADTAGRLKPTAPTDPSPKPDELHV